MTETEELEELLTEVDNFANAMKQRLLDRHSKGYKGWKEVSSEHSEYQIQKVATEISFNKVKDIDVANWCLIHWVNRKL